MQRPNPPIPFLFLLFCCSRLVFAGALRTPLDVWRQQGLAGMSGTNRVAFVHGQFYCASSDLGIYVSTNGERWNRIPAPQDWTRPEVFKTINGDIFAASGTRTWWIRSSSIESFASISTNWIRDIAFGAGVYVATVSPSETPKVITSPDGRSWTLREGAPNAGNAVAFGNNRFVAVGDLGGVATSKDGVVWEPESSGQTNSLRSVTFGNGLFVAVGLKGVILASGDGVDWRPMPSGTTETLSQVIFADERFIAAGRFSTFSSPDGFTWNSAEIPWPSRLVNSVAYGNGRYVAGTDDYIPLYSTNGFLWTRPPLSLFGVVTASDFWRGVYLVATSHGIFTSMDAQNWDLSSISDPKKFAHNDSVIIAMSSGATHWSTDGINWNRIPSRILNDAVWNGTGFVGVGNWGALFYSQDGTNWTTASSGIAQTLVAVEYGSGRYVAVGKNKTILFSGDGINWTQSDYTPREELGSITFANGLFVATGRNGLILTSSDGVAWTEQSSGTALNLLKPTHGHGRWVVPGTALSSNEIPIDWAVLTSTNGIDWEMTSLKPEQPPVSIIANERGFLAAGFSGGVYQSAYFGPPSLKLISASANEPVRFEVQGEIGTTYQLWAKETLDSTDWATVTEFAQTNEVQTVSDSPANVARFYQVRGK
jgi:hypothetical protein